MNELNNKEEKIKDILGGLEIDIDTNDIWGSIEAELPQPKKKRRLGFFLLAGLILLSFSGLTWNMISSDQIDPSTQKDITQTIPSKDKAFTSIENLNPKSSVTTNESKSQNIENNTTTTNEIIQSEFPTNTASSNQSISVSNTIEKTAQKLQDEIQNTVVLQENNSIKNTTTINTQLDKEETKVELTIAQEEKREIAILGLDLVPTLSSQLFDITERQKVVTSPNEIKPLYTFGRQLILQFKLGANQNNTSISDVNSRNEFDTSEFGFETDKIGLSGSFAIGVENNGWRFLAGIAYHQNVSHYERNDVIIFTDLVTGIESYKISTDGDKSAQNGLTTVTVARDNEISFYRQHRAIDFYASIGKRLWSYKGLVLLADAGFGINTFTSSNGYYLKDNAFGFTKISDNNHPYKVNTHWNAIASIELGYDFGKTRIGISPFLRYNPNSITEQTHFYQLKNSQVGMQLSLTYSPTRE